MHNNRKVWFSCGAASAVAAKIAVDLYDDVDVLYCDTLAWEHPDNHRFMNRVEQWIGKEINIVKSNKYSDVEDVWKCTGWLVGPAGARCTTELKKKVRQEHSNIEDIHIFGLTFDENSRIERFKKQNPELNLEWILYNHGITKDDCYHLLDAAGIELPIMYRLGFNNNNCFTGEEKFITTEGTKSFRETKQTKQTVLTSEGWRKASVQYFGVQNIWLLEIERNGTISIIETTKDHEWIIPRYINQSQGTIITTTENLPIGKNILPNLVKPINKEAVKHGFIFGDGTNYKSKTQINEYAKIDFCGDKKELALTIFGTESTRTIHGLNPNWKTLPSITENQKYKLGFLLGLIAADGAIVKGGISISNKNRKTIEKIAEIAKSIGWFVSAIKTIKRDTNYKKDAELTNLTISIASIKKEWLFRKFHQKRFPEKQTNPKGFKILSIRQTTRFEPVYCLTVPNVHNFTLANGMLTRNCVGCVKGQQKYWKKVFFHFPIRYWQMAQIERDMNVAINKTYRGGKRQRIFLDELIAYFDDMPDGPEPDIECGVLCIDQSQE